jgi:hypothetical protein
LDEIVCKRIVIIEDEEHGLVLLTLAFGFPSPRG